jgi:hypothetical protein
MLDRGVNGKALMALTPRGGFIPSDSFPSYPRVEQDFPFIRMIYFLNHVGIDSKGFAGI